MLGSTHEVQEVRGAVSSYDRLGEWDPTKCDHLLAAHGVLMAGLVDRPGNFRAKAAGIQRGTQVVHTAPPAGQVRALMNDLLAWLKTTSDHPLITACVSHYEFEFIHPFVDGNGRMGRLWQSLILSRWKPLFALVPVESLIRDQRAGYYAALNESNRVGVSTPFIAFMLQVIHDALTALDSTPQVARLLAAIAGELDRAALQAALSLIDRKSFGVVYLKPALAAGLIELTRPGTPNSRLQKYRLTAKGRLMRDASA